MKKGEARESSLSRGFAGLAEMAFDAVVAWDSQERITYWNPAAEQLYGWTAQEALGKTSAELFWWARTSQEQKSRKQRQARLKRGETLRGKHRACRKDGSCLRVQYAVRAVLDSHGKLSGYLAIYRDLSAQVQAPKPARKSKERVAGQNAQESERKFSVLLDKVAFAAALSEPPNGIFVDINDAWVNLFGYTRQESIGKTSFELNINPDVDGRARLLAQLREKGFAHDIEMNLQTKSGEWRCFLTNVDTVEIEGQKYFLNAIQDITERKRAEQALRESEERYRYLVKNAPAGIYEIDPRTRRFLEVNDSMCEILGYTREELLALMPDDLLDEEGRERFRQRMLQTLAGEKISQQTEYKVRAKEGREIWGVLNITINYEDGNPRSISVIAYDITERKRAEDALRESRRKYQDLIETTGDFIWEMDSQGRYTYCSPQMETLWGINPEDMLGKAPFDVMLPEDKEKTLEYFREVIDSATPFSGLTTTAFNSQGQLFYVETSGVPFFSHNGELLGFRGITRDVTERNRIRQQIFESSQRLIALMNALPVGVTFSDDPSCQHITGNPAALAQFEVGSGDNLSASAPESSAPGRQVQFFRDGRQITDADLPLQRSVAENREIPPMELEVHLPSGRRWWASASGAPVCDQNGNVIGGVAVTQDITARKQVEDALRENEKQLQLLNETLEQKVQEKTEEVRRLASDVIQAVQHERHRISHILHDDLQQRIYAIQMQLTLLHDALQGETETARREAFEIEQQLSEVLAVTRHLSIDLSPPILRDEGLAHAISWLTAQMRQRYGLPIELQASGPFAIPDEALHVLLFNCVRELLFNVVKHAQASRAVVALQLTEAGLRIEVRDDGKGFSVNMLEQPAGGEMDKEVGARTSLGLSTIRHQLNLFGGRMEIQSEPGTGTRVILVVPVVEG